MKRMAFVVVGAFFLSSCMAAGAVPWNMQNYAGISWWRVTPSSDCEEGVPICYRLDVIDGKEKADITFDIERLPGGGFHIKYSAKGVAAFRGQEIRGEVETAVAAEIAKVLPSITEAIIKAVIKGIKPLP